MVLLCMLCSTKNQRSNNLQVTAGYFAYVDNITKYIVKNLYYIGFLITYKTVQ